MKKSYLLLALLLVVALAFAGCGGSEEKGTDESQGSEVNEVQELGGMLANSYIEILQGEHYFMKYKSTMEIEDGSSAEMTVAMAVDGENIATKSEGSGYAAKTVMKDDKIYTIDDNSKTIMVMDNPDLPDEDVSAGETIETEGLKYLGKGEEDGLVYEEYSVTSGTVKYYFDGEKLVKIVTESEGTSFTMEVLEMTKDYPKEMFEIPSDYQIMEF